MFRYGYELLKLAEEKNKKISELVLEREVELTGESPDNIRERLYESFGVMRSSANSGLDRAIESMGGIIGGDAKRLKEYAQGDNVNFCGPNLLIAAARALSCSEVNASMGRICAAPTAGSCGIVPAVITTAAEILDADKDLIVDGLLVAAGIGIIVQTNATVSGAEGGCQAECGAAAAMAAAGIVEMAGGSPETSFQAASIAFKNIMGLVCDPIAGLVEAPCAKRNASGATNAMLSADLALAGVSSVVPFDEVVDAMFEVGRSLPFELRETALGGIASTKTGKEITKNIFGDEEN
ncbi:MAG: L-serine ammonia-lyase, iron-sulfur-dependent, subunit alpha [Andreesenia angusta]|nr:L-serine ammonia-lyase, iron-sulfur-dependent, subunit alpha [Andreesenia angusta]